MEPDPIGLEGGLNPFVYSNNDPINKVDQVDWVGNNSNL